MNLFEHLGADDRQRALYHGLTAVASECQGNAPRFDLRPLADAPQDIDRLKRWLRQAAEVRDAQGVERCVVSAVRAGATERQLADMLFVAATDHRYLETGHVLDFINKALEALDLEGWQTTEPILASLARSLAMGTRMEESEPSNRSGLIPDSASVPGGEGRMKSEDGQYVAVDRPQHNFYLTKQPNREMRRTTTAMTSSPMTTVAT